MQSHSSGSYSAVSMWHFFPQTESVQYIADCASISSVQKLKTLGLGHLSVSCLLKVVKCNHSKCSYRQQAEYGSPKYLTACHGSEALEVRWYDFRHRSWKRLIMLQHHTYRSSRCVLQTAVWKKIFKFELSEVCHKSIAYCSRYLPKQMLVVTGSRIQGFTTSGSNTALLWVADTINTNSKCHPAALFNLKLRLAVYFWCHCAKIP